MTKTCEQCGRPLEPKPFAAHKRFCSPTCRQAWHGEKRQAASKLEARLGKVDHALFAWVAQETGLAPGDVERVVDVLIAGRKG